MLILNPSRYKRKGTRKKSLQKTMKKVVVVQPYWKHFYPTLTLADMKEITGISIAAIQKLLVQLIQKKYVERGEKDGSWRVFLTQ